MCRLCYVILFRLGQFERLQLSNIVFLVNNNNNKNNEEDDDDKITTNKESEKNSLTKTKNHI